MTCSPADVITYQLTLVNDSTRYDLPQVTVTDTLPIDAHYVDGSLWAASGLYSYADGIITWIGAVPASSRVTIRYQATADEQLAGPHALVNRAVLNDHIGQPRTVHATVYVNLIKPLLSFYSRRRPLNAAKYRIAQIRPLGGQEPDYGAVFAARAT